MVHAIENPQELATTVSENSRVCIKFTAAWCGPCKAIAPVVAEFDRRHTHITTVEVDVDAHKDIAIAYHINSMPTFVFLLDGTEVARVVGADVNAVGKKFKELDESESKGRSAATGSGSKEEQAPPQGDADVAALVEKTKLHALNGSIFYGEAELLNVATKDKSEDLRAIFDLSKPSKPVMSDTDSQILIYLPLTNKVRVKSIYIKTRANAQDETSQPASHLKIWPNLPNVISFEDAASGNFKPAHDAPMGEADSDGWVEVSLKYVLFQNVSSLQFFIDGADEDSATSIEKIVVFGSKGDSTEHTKLEKIE